MKGIIEIVRHRCKLSDIMDGECFVFDDVDCKTVYMKTELVEDKDVTFVNLATGEVDYRSMYEEVIPVHCEFSAKTLTVEEEKEL